MEAFERLKKDVDQAPDDHVRLVALNRLAFETARAGDAGRALVLVGQAEMLAGALKNEAERGHALCTRGICHYLRADYIAGLQFCLDASAIAEKLSDHGGMAAALLSAAACHYQMGTLEEAHTALVQALGMLERAPDDGLAFRAHNTLGAILSNRQNYGEAERHFDLAISIAERVQDDFNLNRARVNRANLHHKLGLACLEAGRSEEADSYFCRGIEVCERIRSLASTGGATRDAAGCAGTLAELYVATGRRDDAWMLFDEMLKHGRELGNSHVQAEALMHLGKLHISRGAFLQARDCLDESIKLAAGVNIQHLVAKAHEGLAEWFEARGDFKQALDQYRHFMEVNEVMLRRELEATARARAIWVAYQRARQEAETYRSHAERLSVRNAELLLEADRHQHDAMHDPLTGLANRRLLDSRLMELVSATRPGENLAVAVIDIDAFKRINDCFTHFLGDEVLKGVASHLRAQCREADLPGRLGGDEFVLVLPATSRDGARQMLQRLMENMADHDWAALHPDLRVTLSIGIAELQVGDSVESLVRRADEALYSAKQQGRNRVVQV